MTKHWGYQGTYNELIQPVFHHVGYTAAMFLDNIPEVGILFDPGTIFAIMGSGKIKVGPESKEARVCEQTIMYAYYRGGI